MTLLRDKLDVDLQWHQLPVDGGQVVSITYVMDENYLYRHTLDRSDKSETLERCAWDQYADDADIRFEPWNGILPALAGDWESL